MDVKTQNFKVATVTNFLSLPVIETKQNLQVSKRDQSSQNVISIFKFDILPVIFLLIPHLQIHKQKIKMASLDQFVLFGDRIIEGAYDQTLEFAIGAQLQHDTENF